MKFIRIMIIPVLEEHFISGHIIQQLEQMLVILVRCIRLFRDDYASYNLTGGTAGTGTGLLQRDIIIQFLLVKIGSGQVFCID
jgi:hypothetical protein